ncbi:MAG: L-rhamnose isomerase, partial [Kiritimatiellae bacterium]|nr:L-rhamnose isomerase [Kiritimatiellia bacterium]
HVVIYSDEIRSIAEEIVRGNYIRRVHLALDFFDASINRVAAWIIGARCVLKALLVALLEPAELLRRHERGRDFTSRLAVCERAKALPYGAVWDYYCLQHEVPPGLAWLDEVRAYERRVLEARK